MSFDFAFDLRSIVTFASDGSVALDGFVLPAIDAFLQEVEMRQSGGPEERWLFSRRSGAL